MSAFVNSAPVGSLTRALIGTNPLATLELTRTSPGVPAPEAVGRNWSLYDEKTTTPAIIDAINGAKRVINVEFFVMTDAGKGEAVTDALEAAARRGVEVNVITDLTAAVTPPFLSYQRFERRIEAAGGHVKLTTHGFFPWDRTKAKRHVDHRKVVTVDGRIAFTGGINYAKMEDPYHDSMIRLTGVNAARLAAEQLDRWSRMNGGKASDVHRASVAQALKGANILPLRRDEMHILVNAPEQKRFEISDEYIRLIRGAKHRLWIASPQYLDQKTIAEIGKAAQRGVDVRLIAPGKAPVGIAPMKWIHNSHFKKLIEKGATVYEIPEVLHRKVLISDDTAIMGSFNITGRSRKHDHEIGMESADRNYVDAMVKTLEKDSSRGTRIDASKLDGIDQWIGDLLAQRLKFSY